LTRPCGLEQRLLNRECEIKSSYLGVVGVVIRGWVDIWYKAGVEWSSGHEDLHPPGACEGNIFPLYFS
jgi:hypothetical protein